jgi:hypothetical protein
MKLADFLKSIHTLGWLCFTFYAIHVVGNSQVLLGFLRGLGVIK